MAFDKYDFLKTEYAASLDLVKYYDARHIDFVKFASGLSAAVPTVVFTFYKLSDVTATAAIAWSFTIFISAVTGLSLLAIFLAMVQNRVYFVFPARQANVIRAYFFRKAAVTGFVNQMYETKDVPIYKTTSTQTMQLAFVALQAALFFGVVAYGLARKGTYDPTTTGITTTLVLGALLLVGAGGYLSGKKTNSADEAVNGGA